jgi:hypothetical protein
MRLLVDRQRIREACDPYSNAAWKHAGQMTRGYDGLLVADAFAERGSIERYAERLRAACEGDLQEFVRAVAAEPLKITSIPKSEPWEEDEGLEGLDGNEGAGRNVVQDVRDIAIRSVFGRCPSNHTASILSDCVDHLLPDVAIAYRPGRPCAVQEAVLDAAKAIADGHMYWVKLDVSDAFNTLPRDRVGEELHVLGFKEDFINRVLAVVAAPRKRRVRGQWVDVPNDRGCPAGMPESSILMNVLFRRFDFGMVNGHRGVFYRRYSDDLLFLARSKQDAEKAVKELLRWARNVGLKLKGVSPNQGPASLVHEIRTEHLVFLGAEIGPDGDIHIPADALVAQIRKIEHRMTLAHREGNLVAGLSRYASGAGIDDTIQTYDWDDIQRSVLQFYRYWRCLNEARAQGFVSRVEGEFGFRATSNTGPRRKVWAATLGCPDDTIGGGSSDRVKIRESITTRVRDEVIPLIKDALLDEKEHTKDTSDHGKDSVSATRDGGAPMGHRDRGEESMADDSFWPTPEEVPGDRASDAVDEDAYEPSCSATGNRGFTRGPRGRSGNGADASGPTTPEAAEPPGRPVLQETFLVFLGHRVVRTERGDAVIIGTAELDASTGTPSEVATPVMVYDPAVTATGLPAEIVVVEHLRQRLDHLRPEAKVFVAMESAWLVKLLLQRGREFRSTGLFQRVRELHAHGSRLVVVGPCRLPSHLALRLEHEVSRLRYADQRARDAGVNV